MTTRRISAADAGRLVRDLTETWEPGAALRLSTWCDGQGLTGAASLLRAGTDPASDTFVRVCALRTLSEALGLTRPTLPKPLPKPAAAPPFVDRDATAPAGFPVGSRFSRLRNLTPPGGDVEDQRIADILASKRALVDSVLAVAIGTRTAILGFPRTRILACETVDLTAYTEAPTKLLDLAFDDDVAPFLSVSSLRIGRGELLMGDPVPATFFRTSYRDAEVLKLREELEKRVVTNVDGSRFRHCNLCGSRTRRSELESGRVLAHADTCLLHAKPAPPFLESVPVIGAGCEIRVVVENTSDVSRIVGLGARCLVTLPC